jgi:hypothetical protein
MSRVAVPMERSVSSAPRRAEETSVNVDASNPDREPEDYVPPEMPEGPFEDPTKPSGQRDGETIEEWVARERPGRPEASGSGRLSEEDRPDDEPELVGELADETEDLSAEEAAVRVRRNAPGATSDASDDYVEPDRG